LFAEAVRFQNELSTGIDSIALLHEQARLDVRRKRLGGHHVPTESRFGGHFVDILSAWSAATREPPFDFIPRNIGYFSHRRGGLAMLLAVDIARSLAACSF
jgi:hypothetical protein